MKKTMYWGAALGVLILILVSKLFFESHSVQYPLARQALLSDSRIAATMGKINGATLIGYGFKGSPEWGCATLTFLVLGEKQRGWVSVRLRRASAADPVWTYFEGVAMDDDFRFDCRTGQKPS